MLDTAQWPSNAFQAAGRGRVHDYIFQRTFGETFSDNYASVGGFAVMNGEVKFSSIWLNMKTNRDYENEWVSDGSQYLSLPEQELVKFAVEGWKARGKNSVLEIPDWLDGRLS